MRRTYYVTLLCVLYIICPLLSQAECVTVTTKAQFLAQLPLTPGKVITITNQTITGAGDWGAVTITGDCTQANPCRIEAESPQGVIFSGNDAGNFCLRGAWYTFSGFRWTGQTGFGDAFSSTGCASGTLLNFDGAQNVTVDNIRIDNISGGGNPINWMELNGGRETLNNTLSNSIIQNWTQSSSGSIYIYAKPDRGFPEGINITNVQLLDRTVTSTTTNCCYWLRAGNTLTHAAPENYSASGHPRIIFTGLIGRRDIAAGNGQDFMHYKANNVIIQDSIFDRVARIKNRQGNNWIVRRNTIINPLETDGLLMYNFGHTIANNLFYTTTGKSRGLTLGKGNGLTTGNDYVAFNNSIVIYNTFDGFATAAIDATRNSNGNNQGTTTVFPQNITFHGNGIRQSTGTMFLGPGGCGVFSAVSHNGRFGSAAAGCMTSGTNNVTTSPLFSDPNAANYTLQEASPWINAGVAVPGTTEDNTDHDGNTAVSTRDIGAFEFGGGSPPVSTCDQIFGGATGYTLCEETGTTCKFNVTLGGSDCETLCGSFGKDCTAAFDNSTPVCTEIGTDTCNTVRTDEICVCTIADSAPEDPPDPPTINITQQSYRWYGRFADDGQQALAAEDSLFNGQYINSVANLTIAVIGDPGIDTHNRNFVLYYEHCNPSCAAYTEITATCTGNPVCLVDNPARTSGDATSNNLALGGRMFSPASIYIDADDPNGGESFEATINADDQAEFTWAIKTGPTASVDDTIQFRIYNTDGTPIETYNVTPSLVIGSGRFNRSGGNYQ